MLWEMFEERKLALIGMVSPGSEKYMRKPSMTRAIVRLVGARPMLQTKLIITGTPATIWKTHDSMNASPVRKSSIPEENSASMAEARSERTGRIIADCPGPQDIDAICAR